MTLALKILLLSAFCTVASAFNHPNGASSPSSPYPKNVVIIVADGLGLVQVGLAMHMSKKPLVLEQFPVIGLQKTHSETHLVTDSGAAATAMFCGEKTYNSAIGMKRDTTPCPNLMELASVAGKKTGVVVTSSLVHATPGAFVGHQKFRGFREAIAADYIDSQLNYVVGGGLMYFTNRFTDDRNLRQELEEHGYHVADYNQMTFRRFAKSTEEHAIYFTSNLEPDKRMDGRAYFPYAVEHGLGVLSSISDDGFLMMVEASQVDYAGHNNDRNYLLTEMKDFDEMLTKVMEFAQKDGETLVVVTGDHSTGGLSITGGKPGKMNVKSGFWTSKHTADMVPVYAFGPGAEIFSGLYDNTDIFHKIRTVGRF